MCGINGYIQFNRRKNKEEMHSIVHKMNNLIIHRGPNDEGIYSDDICSLGMRRLSVIDLERGHQPIWNEEKSRIIVFNGEIYNYKEIRFKLQRKGYTFRTDSDTEVVLIAYDEYGYDCFDLFDGMFALAIYDIRRQEWIVARDRAGEKPLYYYCSKDCFIFGSELKSLISTNVIKKEIDYEALSIYFQLTYIPAPKTIYKDVCKLMPGTYMVIKKDGHTERYTYWRLQPQKKIEEYQDYKKCKAELREKLFASVARRMNSDVPLGAFLSGGFDSSIIVGIMSQLSNNRINTYNIAFKEKQYDESKLARLVARKNDTNHTELVLDWNQVTNDIDSVLENIDEPFADSSLIATYAVSKMTKEYVTVSLTGDAGDELFAGYDKYLGTYYGDIYNRIPQILRKGVLEPVFGIIPKELNIYRKINKVVQTSYMSDYDRAIWLMSLGFKSSELEKMTSKCRIDSLETIKKQYDTNKGIDIQTRIQYVDFCTVLEGDMLAKVDRASMMASLETRVPMLDKDVIELAFNIPVNYKIAGKERKIILKETFKDLLPEELFNAPKHGFGVPIGKWLSLDLLPRLRKYADKDFIYEQGIFDYYYINNMISNHVRKKANMYSELWTFFVFQNWYERVLIN